MDYNPEWTHAKSFSLNMAINKRTGADPVVFLDLPPRMACAGCKRIEEEELISKLQH